MIQQLLAWSCDSQPDGLYITHISMQTDAALTAPELFHRFDDCHLAGRSLWRLTQLMFVESLPNRFFLFGNPSSHPGTHSNLETNTNKTSHILCLFRSIIATRQDDEKRILIFFSTTGKSFKTVQKEMIKSPPFFSKKNAYFCQVKEMREGCHFR